MHFGCQDAPRISRYCCDKKDKKKAPMGFVYSFCYKEKKYFLVILGTDKKFKKRIFARLTGSEPALESKSRYEEKKVYIGGLGTIVCCLDDDNITHELWTVHVNCANACVFICNPDLESQEHIEKTFEWQFENKLCKQDFFILIIVHSKSKFTGSILNIYSNLKNVCMLRIDDSCTKQEEQIDKGVEWLVNNMQS